jgi:zeaxanthin epoxidase
MAAAWRAEILARLDNFSYAARKRLVTGFLTPQILLSEGRPSLAMQAVALTALLLAQGSVAFVPSRPPVGTRLSQAAPALAGRAAPQRPAAVQAQRAVRHASPLHTLAMQKDMAVTPENPLKVIVAGGGVGGMFLAKALQKQGMQVTVLEKTGKFERFGGPIQLASNALATIKGIDEKLFEKVMEKFTFTGTRTNGIKDGIRTVWYTKFEAITKAAEFFSLPYTGVVDRPDLQELLLEEIGGDSTVKRDCAVERYEQLPDGQGVRVFVRNGLKADASTATLESMDADVLVGADGIWSSIRAQMWNQDAKGPKSGTTYSGYTCFAGDTIQKTPYYFDVGYQVYIGPGKYFVTSDVGRGRTQWYAFLALPPGSKSRASNKDYLRDLFSTVRPPPQASSLCF